MITQVEFIKNKKETKYLPLKIERGDCCCCQDPIKVTYEILETKTNIGTLKDFSPNNGFSGDVSFGAPGIKFYGGPPNKKSKPETGNMVLLPAWILENETEIDILIEYDPLPNMPDFPPDVFIYVVFRFESNCNDRFAPVYKEIEFCISIIDRGYKPIETQSQEDVFEKSYYINKIELSETTENNQICSIEGFEQKWEYNIQAYRGASCRNATDDIIILDAEIYNQIFINPNTLPSENELTEFQKTPILVSVIKDNKRLYDGDPLLQGWTLKEIRDYFLFNFAPPVLTTEFNNQNNTSIPLAYSSTKLIIEKKDVDNPKLLPVGLFLHFDLIFSCDCDGIINQTTEDNIDTSIIRRLPRPIVLETKECIIQQNSDILTKASPVDGGGSFDGDPNGGGIKTRLIKYKIDPFCNSPKSLKVTLADGVVLPTGFRTVPDITKPEGAVYNIKIIPNTTYRYEILKPVDDPISNIPNIAPNEFGFLLIYDGGALPGTTFDFNIKTEYTCDDDIKGDTQLNGPVQATVDIPTPDPCPTQSSITINSITTKNNTIRRSPTIDDCGCEK